MAIPATCEQCGESFWADDAQGGQQSQCPHCGQATQVPPWQTPSGGKPAASPFLFAMVFAFLLLLCCVLPAVWVVLAARQVLP